jgi:hypothetical protein
LAEYGQHPVFQLLIKRGFKTDGKGAIDFTSFCDTMSIFYSGKPMEGKLRYIYSFICGFNPMTQKDAGS